MVGRALVDVCRDAGDLVFAFDREALDIANEQQVEQVIKNSKPDFVINCAAWTDVDGCESDPTRAEATNAKGPENLALASRRIGSGFITISTDYVFDGNKDGFYTQRDDPNPQSVYAESKLAGERQAQLAYARTIVVRSGFIFGPGGRNFLSKFLSVARSGKTLQAIYDSTGTPTYSLDLAARLRELATIDLPGIYHVVNGGMGANYKEIIESGLAAAGLDAQVSAVSMYSLNRPAARPKNSRLRCLLSERIALKPLRSWKDAMKHFAVSELQTGATNAS
jgi:dTDP-4-dehydrorhamnose reductase